MRRRGEDGGWGWGGMVVIHTVKIGTQSPSLSLSLTHTTTYSPIHQGIPHRHHQAHQCQDTHEVSGGGPGQSTSPFVHWLLSKGAVIKVVV